jgi:hypothetical protein
MVYYLYMRRYNYKRTYIWNEGLAYVAGLIASDGCLVNNGRHINITSKDIEIIDNVQTILGINVKVATKTGQFGTQAYHLQFSNVALYDFFLQCGITPAKSKTIGPIAVPDAYYADFLRGYFDGDGTIYGYWDTRWPKSLMYYTGYVSASPKFLIWLQHMNMRLIGTTAGKIKPNVRAFTLAYAKTDTQKLFLYMYRELTTPRLARKYAKFIAFLEVDPYASKALIARVLESVDRLA